MSHVALFTTFLFGVLFFDTLWINANISVVNVPAFF